MGEFELIRRYFKRPQNAARIGVGDDCAIFSPSPDREVCITSDLLVQDHHFLPDVSPQSLGHKALAVNLSDLAAMGAQPVGFLLSLGLPHTKEAWLEAFAKGMFALAEQHNCSLVGGDTTACPVTLINITAWGEVKKGGGILRSGAKVGNDIWVSGTVGDAALALACRKGQIHVPLQEAKACFTRMDYPTPRVDLGLALAPFINSMIDLSDGLAGDLPHILKASDCSAQIELTALPLCPALAQLNFAQRTRLAVCGGDDYELLFTAPATERPQIQQIAKQLAIPLSLVGRILPKLGAEPKLEWLENGQGSTFNFHGFQHFSEP